MKIVQTKSHINKKIPFIEKHEYDYHDVINDDNAIGARKKPMIEKRYPIKLTQQTVNAIKVYQREYKLQEVETEQFCFSIF